MMKALRAANGENMKRNIVLVDIDHVLSAAWPRDCMIGNNTWDEYHEAAHQDEPIHDMVALVNALQEQDFYIVAVTARPSKWRTSTATWMIKHSIHVSEILMRNDDDFRPSPELKIDLVKCRFPDAQERVAFLLEDRDDVIAAFKAFGITCLQVHGRRR